MDLSITPVVLLSYLQEAKNASCKTRKLSFLVNTSVKPNVRFALAWFSSDMLHYSCIYNLCQLMIFTMAKFSYTFWLDKEKKLY